MEMFQSLSSRKTPASVLSASVVLHVGLLSVLILLPLIAPQTLHVNYRTMLLAPPPPPAPQPEPVKVVLPPLPIPKPPPRPADLIVEKPPAPTPKVVAPAPEIRLVEAPKPPEPSLRSVASPLLDPKPTPPAPPTLPVITNSFSSVAAPVIPATPARNTAAAGFSDTTSSHDVNRASKTTSVAGFGDNVGARERGRPSRAESIGTIAGFDGGIAGGTHGRGNSGSVMAAGFTAIADAPRATASARSAEPTIIDKPVEVLSKPRPDYTDEARKLRIEGEVLVRVMFSSSGQARVIEVLKGLGYGLDENAIRAAEQIRFKPAQRSGQSVDSTAIVHIIFQLAY
jgi:TonB family protein